MSDLDQYLDKDHKQYLANPDGIKLLKLRLKDGIDTETVGGVQDGDTVTGDVYDLSGSLVESDVYIREGSGIDTPETIDRDTQKKNPDLPSYPRGELATEYLKDILQTSAGSPSEIFLIERKDSDLPKDAFGRRTNPMITPDGKLVSVELLKKGYATTKYLYVRKYQAPYLFNKKKLQALNDANIKKEKVSPTVKITSTKEVLAIADKYGWMDSEGKAIPGACKIGAVWLPIPPSHITVTEVNENEVINTMRTPGNPKIKTGKQEIRIELEIFFPSLYHINKKFRPLLAQFMRAPFLPIENDHIRGIVMPDVIWSEPKPTQRKQNDMYPPTNSTIYERTASKDMSDGHFTSFGDDFKGVVSKEYKSRVKTLKDKRKLVRNDIIEQQKRVGDFQKYLRDSVLVNIQDTSTKRRWETLIRNLGINKISSKDKILLIRYFLGYQASINTDKVSTNLDIFLGEIPKLQAEESRISVDISKLKYDNVMISVLKNYKAPAHMYEDVQLAVALRDISVSTVPGYPEALQCNLTMSVFNYAPYSYDFSFLPKMEDAMKQAEYNYRKLFLQYPEEMRKNLDVSKIYDPPAVIPTKNMSESEPFLSYITPLLTGVTVQDTRTIKMKVDNVEQPEMKRGFLFMAPRNWLRLVNDPLAFKKFDFEYEISELSTEQRDVLDAERGATDIEVMGDIFRLLEGIGLEFDVLQGFSGDINFILSQVRKLVNLETLQERIDEYTGTLEDYKNSSYINLKFDIPDRGGTVPQVKRGRYRIDKFRDEFLKLKGGGVTGRSIINKIQNQFRVKSLATYGYQNIYKFIFAEDQDTVISGVSASMSNKLASIPLLSHTLPTFQHMGSNDWTIQISLQTCNMNLIRILRSLSIKASEGRVLRHQTGKSWWINKSNSLYFNPDEDAAANGFMKMLGINHALFQDFVYETIKEKPGWWNVTIRLVQSDMDLFLYESLLRVGFFRSDVITDVQKQLRKEYKWGDETVNDKYKYISRYIFADMRNYIYRMIFNVFYGGGISTPPILSDYISDKNLEASKMLFTDSEIQSIIKDNPTPLAFKTLLVKKYNEKLPPSPTTQYAVVKTNTTRDFSVVGKPFIVLPTGDRLHLKEFESRLDSVIHMTTYNIGVLPVKAALGVVSKIAGRKDLKSGPAELDIGTLQYALSKYVMNTLAIRTLLSAPEESYDLIKQLKGKGGNNKYDKRDTRPIHNIPHKSSGQSYDLYSNYFDLNLPSYQGGLLSTPAGFFYTNYSGKDLFSLDSIKDRINNTRDVYENSWKFHLLDGLAMYDILDSKGLLPFSVTSEEIAETKKLKSIVEARYSQVFDEGYNKLNAGEGTAKKVVKTILNVGSKGKVVGPSEIIAKFDWKKQKELSQLSTEINRFDKVLESAKKERKEIFEGGYEKIVEKARLIDNQWQNTIRKLDTDKKMELVAHRSSHVIKQAMAIMSCLRLASIQNIIDSQDADKLENDVEGIHSSLDRLILIRQDLISQLQMLSVTPATNLYGAVTPWSLDNTKELYNRVTDSYNAMKAKDKTLSMERAYPTMKLYFIEEDSNEWGALDDYYLYNAVESVEVIKSKNAASSVANIIVTNMSKNLTDPYSTHRTEAPLKEGTADEQSVLSIYLREGTTVMVKAGFDNNPEGLDVIFYGKVVSNTNGDRMTIVAQSFGAELLEVVNNGIPKKLGYNSAARTHGDVVLWAASTLNGLQHFGSPSNLERLGLVDRHGSTPYYASSKWRKWDYLRRVHPIVGFYFRFAVYDPRFENVYLPYSKLAMSPWTQIAANIVTNVGKSVVVSAVTIVAVTAVVLAVSAIMVGTAGTASAAAVAGSAIATVIKGIFAKSVAAGIILSLVSLGGGVFVSAYFGNLILALKTGDNVPLFWRSTFDWVIRTEDFSNKAPTMWALLNEISLYHNDYIVTTVPYNQMYTGATRETLYVGPRDGLYKYTDVFDSKENIETITKDIELKRKNIGLILNPKKRDELAKRSKKAKRIIEKYNKKTKKGTRLDKSELVELNEAREELNELASAASYIEKYEIEEGIYDERVLESDKEYFISGMKDNVNALVKGEKIEDTTASEIFDNIRELTSGTSLPTEEAWDRLLEKRGFNVPALKNVRLKGLAKFKAAGQDRRWTRLDDISYVLSQRYKYMTPEEKNMKISSFESTGILLAIDNPSDLSIKKKVIEQDEKGISTEYDKIIAKYPGYMNITNYYYVDSFAHIINNDIRASAEDIHNHVVVKYPGDPTTKQVTSGFQSKEFWADDNIKGGNIRTYISEQYNIDPLSVPLVPKDFEHWLEFGKKFNNRKLYGNIPRVYQVGYNILANQMRPMYRGEITVIGMPYLKPYDIVFINDYHNKMWGPIEVETVKHKFDGNGFVTHITPNAVINYMKPGKVAELGFMQGLRLPSPLGFMGNIVGFNLFSKIGTANAAVSGASLAAFAIGGGAALPWIAGLTAFSATIGLKVGFSLWNWGVGKFMGRDIVNITGLWQGTKPLVAGMEGAYKDDVVVHMVDRVRSLFDWQISLGLVEQ